MKDKLKQGLLLKVVLLGCLIWVLLLDSYTVIDLYRSKSRHDHLQERIEVYEAENVKLTETNKKLKTDPEAWEKIAREKLGMQKKDENVYRFIDKNKAENKSE